MPSGEYDVQAKMHTVSSDDDKQYDFDFYALTKVKKRERMKIYSLILIIFILSVALVAMVILYHRKATIIQTKFVDQKDELIKAKVIAYKRIAKYGEDCHSKPPHKTVCGANAYCRYLQGTYRCDCKKGYIGDGIGDCKDVHFSIDFKTSTIKNIPEVTRVYFPKTYSMSICFWYKLAETLQKWLSAFMYTSVEVTGSNDLMIWFTKDKVHVTMRSSGQSVLELTLPVNVWTHFCWIWESDGRWLVYLNGKKNNTDYDSSKKTFIGAFPESYGSLLLGQDKDEDVVNEPKQMFRGVLTQFYIYHKRLSDDEVFAAFENRPPTQNITVGWWQFKNKTKGNDIVQTDYPFDFKNQKFP